MFRMKRLMVKFFILWMAFASSVRAADQAFLRQKTLEILDACSPDGSKIVRMGLKLAPVHSSGDFTNMITGNDERACLTSINTVVHEENHGLNTFMPRYILKDKFGRLSDVFYEYDYFYLGDGQFTLVKKTPAFPSKELVPFIPERLRTYRFADYINTDEKLQSTQNEGIYGLLDEFNSYYLGTKAAFDLLPYYEKKGSSVDWHDYFTGVNTTYYGCLEFRFYILKYLMYAKEHRPDMYRGFMKRKDLLYTFLAVDKNVSNLIRKYFENKTAIFKRLQGYGWKVTEEGNMLTITRNGRSVGHMNFMDVYTLLDEEMKKSGYQAVLRTVEASAKDWNPESVYEEVERAMKESVSTDTEGEIPSAETPTTETVSRENRLYLEDSGNLSDPRKDVPYPFIDLVNASAVRANDGLSVRMKLAAFPGSLTFNQSGVRTNEVEYRWAALFDVDGDGTDDYSLEAVSFKSPGSAPKRGGLLENVQRTLWELKTDGATRVDVSVRGEKRGNELVLEVPPCDLVSGLGEKSRIHFSTFYTDGKNAAQDLLPD